MGSHTVGTTGEGFDIVEASILEVLAAQRTGVMTSSQILEEHLIRIEAFDRGPDGLNSMGRLHGGDAAECRSRPHRQDDDASDG